MASDDKEDFLGTPEVIRRAIATGGNTKPKSSKSSGGARRHRATAQVWEKKNEIEDSLIDAIDIRKDIQEVAALLRDVSDKKMSLSTAFKSASPSMAKQLIKLAFGAVNEKNKLEAVKTLLALGGHQPTQKHEISRIDPDAPREAIMSMIRGSQKALADAGIEIVDDEAKTEANDK